MTIDGKRRSRDRGARWWWGRRDRRGDIRGRGAGRASHASRGPCGGGAHPAGRAQGCKLATVEISLADYAKKRVPKTFDLPFTKPAGGVSVLRGCGVGRLRHLRQPSGIVGRPRVREVRITLPHPRILSVDILRFETINERSGFLNAIPPEERNRWYGEARAALENGALAQGALDKAQAHARELFAGFVGAPRIHAGVDDTRRGGQAAAAHR